MIRALEPKLLEEVAQQQDVVAPAYEREGDEIDARLHAGAQVALVLLRQRRQVHHHARQVDVTARAELARREHLTAHVRGIEVLHLEAHQAAVDQDRRADRHVRGQPRVVDGHATHARSGLVRVELELITDGELDRTLDHAGADLRTFDVHHHGHVTIEVFRNFAHARD